MRRRSLLAAACAAMAISASLRAPLEHAAASAAAPICEPGPASAAAKMAAECNQRVEVLSRRTETTQVYLNPDGTATIEQFAFPQRVRRLDGSWMALDPTLSVTSDGTIKPSASPLT